MDNQAQEDPFAGLVAILRPNGTVKEISRRGKLVLHSDGPADREPGEWRRVAGEEAAELYRAHCRHVRDHVLADLASTDPDEVARGERMKARMVEKGTWIEPTTG